MDNSIELAPLAERMRANSIDNFYGQQHIVGENSLLRRAIKLDRLGSCIFYGPPGVGKSTLANIIANTTKGEIISLNAVSCGVADVKKAQETGRNNIKMFGKKTYLLLDECHRFNKTQLDSLLPAVEKGELILIGSTTENPYYSMTPAIVSRCRVFEFYKLSNKDIESALKSALLDSERGLGRTKTIIDENAMEHLVNTAGGDLRVALNALELAVLTTPPNSDGLVHVTLKDAEQSIQKRSLAINENDMYDNLSAFCKSLRGSDSDAGVYYALRLIEAGVDPLIIARRLVVHSSEDVGMADPQALVIATSALTALEKLGKPEGLIPLVNAIIYVCEAEKSNSVVIALNSAKADVENEVNDEVPYYLKNRKDINGGTASYKYPHDYGGYVKQQYLPDRLKDKVYYKPKGNGFEKNIIKRKER